MSAARLGTRRADCGVRHPSSRLNKADSWTRGWECRLARPRPDLAPAGPRPRICRTCPPRPQREGSRVMRLRIRLAALAFSLLGAVAPVAIAADSSAPAG